MNDLISRDAAIKALMEQADLTKGTKSDVHVSVFFESAARLIQRIPAVDAEPVQHGEWEEVQIQRSDKKIISYYACSLCGRILVNPFNYCPHCGAEMGGDDE